MLSCEEVTHLVSQGLDRRLSRTERWGVRVHQIYCLGCRRFARQVVFLRQAAQQLRRHDPVRLSASARARIGKALGDNH